ncbi:MAG: hypothetical protein ED559_06180 [Phycisphaera sp.]|nr:MAG: hypothetical protein ED559_06180 [Phycisphaera sp.]
MTGEPSQTDLEARLVEQEFRLLRIVKNWLAYHGEEQPKHLREASTLALKSLAIRVLVGFLLLGGTSGLAIYSLVLAHEANALFKAQNNLLRAQADEVLAVTVNPHANGAVRVTGYDFGRLGSVVQFPWLLTISNTGQQRLSVTNYRIVGHKGAVYSGLDGGLFDHEMRPVSFPLVLQSGEAVELVILVGHMIPTDVIDRFPVSASGTELLDTVLTKHLAAQGIDVFGNRVTAIGPDGSGSYTFHEPEKAPVFTFVLQTARGTSAIAECSKYGIPRVDSP